MSSRASPSRLTFRTGLSVVAGVLPAALVLIVLFLTVYAWPAIILNGGKFLVHSNWNTGNLYASPVMQAGVLVQPGADYSIWFLEAGTLLTTFIAIVLAVPIGVAAAVFLAEAVPGRARTTVSFFVELLAAVPSVVFGLWGFVVLIPFFSNTMFPFLSHYFGWVPYFGGAAGSGYGLLTAGIVLSLMIVPLIAATVRDAIVVQPPAVRESVMALGASHFEAIWHVTIPSVRRVIIGATILALGRALGETMAVLMVSGNALGSIPGNIYGPVSTMAAFIASQLDSALGDTTGFAVRSLAEIALVLAFISVVVNIVARIILSATNTVKRPK